MAWSRLIKLVKTIEFGSWLIKNPRPDMQFLTGSAVEAHLAQLCGQAEHEILFVSAYATHRAFAKISNRSSDLAKPHKRILVRWNKRDLVTGASDLEVYNLAKQNGWTIFVNPLLHAKVYQVDESVLLGSANLTLSGLNIEYGYENIEACVAIPKTPEIALWLAELVDQSVPVDDALFQDIACEVAQAKDATSGSIGNFSPSIAAQIYKKKLNKGLYTGDMLWTEDPAQILEQGAFDPHGKDEEHDRILLALDRRTTYEQLRSAFRASPPWLWLTQAASTPRYYGELTALLHDKLLDEPSVYRKEVKQLLSTLLRWGQVLCEEHCKVEQPNYSQRIQIIQ